MFVPSAEPNANAKPATIAAHSHPPDRRDGVTHDNGAGRPPDSPRLTPVRSDSASRWTPSAFRGTSALALLARVVVREKSLQFTKNERMVCRGRSLTSRLLA